MGYSYEMFADIERLSLPKNGRVLDLGSQDIFISDSEHLDAVNRFIARYDGPPLPSSVLGRTMEVGDIWRNAGFDYRCVDVDERPTTIRVDLQNFDFPAELRNTFDLVTNMGTTEHLASPLVGLALMHYACKPNGALFSDVPIFGWGNHGLANLTPKFWHQLQFINGYEIVTCRFRDNDESTVDPFNFYHPPSMGYMERLTEARGISWMIRFVAVKRGDNAFIPPYDAILPNSDGSKEADIMLGLLRPFLLAKIWTEREAWDAVDAAIVRLGKPYRTRTISTYHVTGLPTLGLGELSLSFDGSAPGPVSVSIHLRAIPHDKNSSGEIIDVADQFNFAESCGPITWTPSLELPHKAMDYLRHAEIAISIRTPSSQTVGNGRLCLAGLELKPGQTALDHILVDGRLERIDDVYQAGLSALSRKDGIIEAERCFALLTSQAPRFGEGLFQAARLAEKRGDVTKATELMTEAVRLTPDHELYQSELSTLRARLSSSPTETKSFERQ